MKLHIEKNKSRAIRLLTGICLSATLWACSDSFLDLKDPNNFGDDKFWRNKADAESGLAAAYSPIKFQMNGYYGAFDGWLNLNSRGDDIFTILNEEASMWDIATFQNSATTGNDPYGQLYTGIQRANVVLKYIDQVPEAGISAADRNMIRDEALVLRAYQYFLLVNNYGQVPLRLKPSSDEGQLMPKADEATIWAQIETDLQAAINDGNLPVARSSSEKGRLEQGAAITILAKVYEAQHKYEAAKPLLQNFIADNYGPGKRYQLMDNFADNFTPTHKNNAESVFELQYSSDGDLTWGNEDGTKMGNSIPQFVGPAISGGWAKLMPSAFAVSEFAKETRGSSAQVDSKYDKRMYASLFFTPSDYGDWVSADNGWYSPQFYGGLYSMQDLWDGNSSKMAGGAPTYTVSGANGAMNGQFLLKKYTAYWVNSKSADSMGNKEGKSNNLRILRFDEVLLMYAEACAQTNDAAQANWALNEIRHRAGLPEKTFAAADLMAEVEHQCLLEFFGEGHRFDDLRRWYSVNKIQLIFKDNEKQGASNFQRKHLYYPIPSGELNNNKAMTQNDLWQ
ncbi:MAG: RagB/SusD family nutrient uptake outer membrane protein [Mediterranea sp.]|jgi:hypothetical protein|nr:RagB/SusD family nutrient uptake outer membrane protein [Mediterranea sp.]